MFLVSVNEMREQIVRNINTEMKYETFVWSAFCVCVRIECVARQVLTIRSGSERAISRQPVAAETDS